MYERMLDKQIQPSFEEMLDYCGEAGTLWLEMDQYLKERLNLTGSIRFPYGNKYGWGVKYNNKGKHVCDVFAEKGAFLILISMSDAFINSIYRELGAYAQKVWEEKYPCGNGGWLNYRVTKREQLIDIEKIIERKIRKGKI